MSGIALKLTSLLVRTVAKPIATTLKHQAKNHESFRKSCIRIAQTMHLTDVKLRMRLIGEKKIKIRPLNDNKAIENGANFISEFFIFLVAGSLILYESFRSRKKANNERDALFDDISTLQSEIEYIKIKLNDYNIKLDDYNPPEGINPKYIDLNKLTDRNLSSKSTSASISPSTAPSIFLSPSTSTPPSTSPSTSASSSTSQYSSPPTSPPTSQSPSQSPAQSPAQSPSLIASTSTPSSTVPPEIPSSTSPPLTSTPPSKN